MGYHGRGKRSPVTSKPDTGSFHPGKILRNWSLARLTYRGYDFSGNRTDEYYNFTGVAELLNDWDGSLDRSYDPPRYSHYLTGGGPMAYYPACGIMRRVSISSDSRKAVVLSFTGHYRTHPSGGYNYSFNVGLRWKPPANNFSLSVSPGDSWRHSEGQFIRKVTDALKPETYGVRYILSDIIQETVPLEIRISWSFTPRLSLQAYLQPYIGGGRLFPVQRTESGQDLRFRSFRPGQWIDHHAYRRHLHRRS